MRQALNVYRNQRVCVQLFISKQNINHFHIRFPNELPEYTQSTDVKGYTLEPTQQSLITLSARTTKRGCNSNPANTYLTMTIVIQIVKNLLANLI